MWLRQGRGVMFLSEKGRPDSGRGVLREISRPACNCWGQLTSAACQTQLDPLSGCRAFAICFKEKKNQVTEKKTEYCAIPERHLLPSSMPGVPAFICNCVTTSHGNWSTGGA